MHTMTNERDSSNMIEIIWVFPLKWSVVPVCLSLVMVSFVVVYLYHKFLVAPNESVIWQTFKITSVYYIYELALIEQLSSTLNLWNYHDVKIKKWEESLLLEECAYFECLSFFMGFYQSSSEMLVQYFNQTF